MVKKKTNKKTVKSKALNSNKSKKSSSKNVSKSTKDKKSKGPKSSTAGQKNGEVAPRALSFRQVDDEREIREVFDYNIDAFSDTPDFHWGIDEIKEEMKHGWKLFATLLGDEVIAAVFLKLEGGVLLSKNTAIKMQYQGSGYSHQIKSFIESKARELKAKKILHYCRIDNFRMYSLNEGHGYKKTNKVLPDEQVVEWVKVLR